MIILFVFHLIYSLSPRSLFTIEPHNTHFPLFFADYRGDFPQTKKDSFLSSFGHHFTYQMDSFGSDSFFETNEAPNEESNDDSSIYTTAHEETESQSTSPQTEQVAPSFLSHLSNELAPSFSPTYTAFNSKPSTSSDRLSDQSESKTPCEPYQETPLTEQKPSSSFYSSTLTTQASLFSRITSFCVKVVGIFTLPPFILDSSSSTQHNFLSHFAEETDIHSPNNTEQLSHQLPLLPPRPLPPLLHRSSFWIEIALLSSPFIAIKIGSSLSRYISSKRGKIASSEATLPYPPFTQTSLQLSSRTILKPSQRRFYHTQTQPLPSYTQLHPLFKSTQDTWPAHFSEIKTLDPQVMRALLQCPQIGRGHASLIVQTAPNTIVRISNLSRISTQFNNFVNHPPLKLIPIIFDNWTAIRNIPHLTPQPLDIYRVSDTRPFLLVKTLYNPCETNLYDLCIQQRRLTLEQGISIVESLKKSMDTLHTLKLGHGDIHPRNILICRHSYQARLIDFDGAHRSSISIDPKMFNHTIGLLHMHFSRKDFKALMQQFPPLRTRPYNPFPFFLTPQTTSQQLLLVCA